MAFKYREIQQQVLADAVDSKVDLLPSESEICQKYGVSRTTAIKALRGLESQDLIRREVGRGSFLIRSKVRKKIKMLVGQSVPELISFMQLAAQIYADENPNAEVEVVTVNTANWAKSILTVPGTKVICSANVGFLAERNLLVRLDERDGFAHILGQINSEMVEWSTGNRTEQCNSLPLHTVTELLAFNRDYARELGLDTVNGPRCWDDLLAWGKAAISSGKMSGAHIIRNNMLPLSYLLTLAQGKPLISSSRSGVEFEFSRGAEWLSFFRQLHREGAMEEYPDDAPDPILRGECLMSLAVGPWILTQSRARGIEGSIGLVPIPAPEPGYSSFSRISKEELAIVDDGNDDDATREIAWDFIRFLLVRPDIQRKLIKAIGFLAINREVYREQQCSNQYLPFIQAQATGRMRNDHPVQHGIMRVLYKYYYPTVLGDLHPTDAAAKITEMCNLLIEIAGSSGLSQGPEPGLARM